MIRIWGVLLISLALIITAIFLYGILSSTEKFVWQSLVGFVLPLILFVRGYFQLRSLPGIPSVDMSRTENKTSLNDIAFNEDKRRVLVEKLLKFEGEMLVPCTEFFDGNFDDQGSIGCNLYPNHPGIAIFRNVFFDLSNRDDVSAVYVRVSEVEPDAESWPYADRVYIFGEISFDDLRQLTMQVTPTEITDGRRVLSSIPQQIRDLNDRPLKVLWWD